jgi:precorrin-3B methylase
MTRGSLDVVGVGISTPGQVTFEAASRIERAARVFCMVPNPLAEYWVRTRNPNTESLAGCYAVGKDRRITYREVVEKITNTVREGARVCAVSYGHPGIAAYPFHECIRVLRAEGFAAEMLPGISAQDTLVADLGLDPVSCGWLSYEATDFLVRRRAIDPSCNLILWQIGVIAESGYKAEVEAWNRDGITILMERLLEVYPAQHDVVVYEAASLTACEPAIVRVALEELPGVGISAISTLFVPPAVRAPIDPAMAKRLRLSSECLSSGAPSS